MAIKGKNRGRSARAVTRGPKPVYQPVKKPLIAKKELWLVIAGILGTVIVAALVVGFVLERNASEEDALEERMRAAVAQYRGEIDSILASVGQPRPPSGYDAFPALAQAVAAVEEETRDEPIDAGPVRRTADDTMEDARTALQALDEIDATGLIRGKGFSEEFALYVINSRENFARAMTLYREAARLLSLALDAEGADRASLIASARNVMDAANEIITRGYAEYVEAQAEAGAFEPTSPLAGRPTGS